MNALRSGCAVLAAGLALACLPESEGGEPRVATEPAAAPVVQIALLLDTSNSMDGLIDQARSELWKVVNEFAVAHRNGRPVDLEVALYEYGNNRLVASEGYVRQVLSFTSDLDLVSEQLFALTTDGGEEYCGRVIEDAVTALPWSTDTGALKAIFIAGNEPFTQGPVDSRAASRRARGRGITVNTIHCGPHATGVDSGWETGALVADGSFVSIDHDRAVAHIAAPQDHEIARLGEEMNETYVPFGASGEAGESRQSAQDSNATASGAGARTQRALAKASRHYKNSTWDLVDAVERGEVALGDVKTGELPEAMRCMSLGERQGYLKTQAERRAQLKEKILELNRAREEHVGKVRRERAESGTATLDVALIESLREQARKKGLSLE